MTVGRAGPTFKILWLGRDVPEEEATLTQDKSWDFLLFGTFLFHKVQRSVAGYVDG